jgi:hypothetical protein
MRVKKNVYKVLVEKPEGKRPRRKSWLRWGIILKWNLEK